MTLALELESVSCHVTTSETSEYDISMLSTTNNLRMIICWNPTVLT
jgi:hypothetical protein